MIKNLFLYIINEYPGFNSSMPLQKVVNCAFWPSDAPDNSSVLVHFSNVDMDFTGGVNEAEFFFRVRNINYWDGRIIAERVLKLFAGKNAIELPEVENKKFIIFSCPFHAFTQLPSDDKNRFVFEARFTLKYEELSNG